jgi:hypothetical protein
MAQIHIKGETSAEVALLTESTAQAECTSCTQIEKDNPRLDRTYRCAGEWTQAIAYIYAPQYQNMLVIPSATSLPDAVDKTRRCGGNPQSVTFYSSPVLACAPYIRCNL